MKASELGQDFLMSCQSLHDHHIDNWTAQGLYPRGKRVVADIIDKHNLYKMS